MSIQKNTAMPVWVRKLLFFLWLFVFIGFSPFNWFFLIVLLIILSTGQLTFSAKIFPIAGLLTLHLIISLIALTNASNLDFGIKAWGMMMYLYVMMIFVSAIIDSYGYEAIEGIFKSTSFITSISAILSLGAFFGILPIADIVLFNGDRAAGLVANPNYFGAAIDMAIIYFYCKIEGGAKVEKIITMAVILLLTFTVILTYSRAAWLALVLGIVCYLLLRAIQRRSKATILKFIIGIAGFVIFTGVGWLIADSLGYTEMAKHRFELQDYDTDRFLVHDILREKSLEHPLGIGPGQSIIYLANFYNNIQQAGSPESSYLEILFETGYMGELVYLLFLAYLFALSLRISLSPWKLSKVSAMVSSIFYGMLLYGTIMSTTGWRHFWIIAGIIAGLDILYAKERALYSLGFKGTSNY